MRPSRFIVALLAIAGCPSEETGAGAGDGTTDGAGPMGIATSTTTATGAAATTGAATATGDDATTMSAPSPTTTGVDDGTTTTTTTGDGATTTGDDGTSTTTGVDETTGPPPEMPWEAKGCPDIYKQDILPTFELEISPTVLSKLEKEWASGDGDKPDHPLASFKYEDTVITDAVIQLRGNPKWWFQSPDKMQFEIKFNENDKQARFMGLKSVLFDAARYNESFLRDRLALKIMRDVGVPAPCANNARVVVNGEYYGLFVNIEKVDSEFLERYFEFPDGNLYKRDDWEKKTNEEDKDDSDVEELIDADNYAELDAVMNIDQAILEWAAEAVLPDNDGAWAGGLNYYVYNDPLTGFNIIPWDKDATFTRIPHDVDPYKYIKPNDHGRPFYDIVTKTPAGYQKYVQAIEHVLKTGYDAPTLQARIDEWSAQIDEAAKSDPNKPFSDGDYSDALKELRTFVKKRAEFVEDWLD